MTDYYVASGGSNTSPYDTWAKAATSPFTVGDLVNAGDNVYVDKDLSFTVGTSDDLGRNTTLNSSAVIWHSVDRTGDPEPPTAITKGVTITQNSGVLDLEGNNVWHGFIFDLGTAGSMDIEAYSYQQFIDCEFVAATTTSTKKLTSKGAATSEFINCVFDTHVRTTQFQVEGIEGAHFIFRGCRVTSTANALTRFFDQTTNRFNTFEFYGFDFSQASTSAFVLWDTSTVSAQTTFKALGNGVLLPANASFYDSLASGMDIELYSVGVGDEYYSIYKTKNGGEVVDDTTTYLDATYDGTTGYSHEATTNSESVIGDGIDWILCEDFLDTAPSSITVYTTSATQLTEQELQIQVSYPDSTNQALQKTVLAHDPLSTTNIPADTSSWTSADTFRQAITISLSGNGVGQYTVRAHFHPSGIKAVNICPDWQTA